MKQSICRAAVCMSMILLTSCAQNTAVSAPAATSTPEPTATPEPQPIVETVRFSATGDNLIHQGIFKQAAARAQNDPSAQRDYDFSFCYANLKDFYSEFDVNWINQETLVNDVCEPANYPCFSTPGAMAWDLYDVGFRVFSLSNNHSYDKGSKGINGTRELWSTLPDDIVTPGLYDLSSYDNLDYHTVNGITIGYLSYTDATNGIPTPSGAEYGVVYLNQHDIIASQVNEMRQKADFVVVSCHWGVEGSHVISDAQRASAKELADLGADLIIGTHPHVVQDCEWITAADGHEAFVAYSLGNYLNLQARPQNMVGTLLDIVFEKTTSPDGTVTCHIKEPQLHPVVCHYGSHYSEGHMYLLRDYTEELAKAHGVHANYPTFGLDYIHNLLVDNISAEYLAL